MGSFINCDSHFDILFSGIGKASVEIGQGETLRMLQTIDFPPKHDVTKCLPVEF